MKERRKDEMAKILIVGKSPSIREFMAEELAGAGHLVVAIGNPALVEELLITLEPELILLDFQLSRTAERLRKRGSHLPFLTFTSYNAGKEKIRLETVDGYGIRSFPFETLKQKIPELPQLKGIHGCEWVKEDPLPPSAYSLRGGKGSKSS